MSDTDTTLDDSEYTAPPDAAEAQALQSLIDREWRDLIYTQT